MSTVQPLAGPTHKPYQEPFNKECYPHEYEGIGLKNFHPHPFFFNPSGTLVKVVPHPNNSNPGKGLFALKEGWGTLVNAVPHPNNSNPQEEGLLALEEQFSASANLDPTKRIPILPFLMNKISREIFAAPRGRLEILPVRQRAISLASRIYEYIESNPSISCSAINNLIPSFIKVIGLCRDPCQFYQAKKAYEKANHLHIINHVILTGYIETSRRLENEQEGIDAFFSYISHPEARADPILYHSLTRAIFSMHRLSKENYLKACKEIDQKLQPISCLLSGRVMKRAFFWEVCTEELKFHIDLVSMTREDFLNMMKLYIPNECQEDCVVSLRKKGLLAGR